jgi:hypothetical protein
MQKGNNSDQNNIRVASQETGTHVDKLPRILAHRFSAALLLLEESFDLEQVLQQRDS